MALLAWLQELDWLIVTCDDDIIMAHKEGSKAYLCLTLYDDGVVFTELVHADGRAYGEDNTFAQHIMANGESTDNSIIRELLRL